MSEKELREGITLSPYFLLKKNEYQRYWKLYLTKQ